MIGIRIATKPQFDRVHALVDSKPNDSEWSHLKMIFAGYDECPVLPITLSDDGLTPGGKQEVLDAINQLAA
jgi:hypothetical protein